MEGSGKSKWDKAKQVDLVDYLDTLGFQPNRIRNHDYWYLSPFRTEKIPSFKVNRKKNVWYDHGEGAGGSVIDFAAKFHGCTPYEALDKLSGEAAKPFSFHRTSPPIDLPESKVEVLAVRPLTRPVLLQYLQGRGVDAVTAQKYCAEIDFRIGKLNYTTIGFANRSGGYDLRARWFKGSSSPKDVTLISTGSPKLCVLEGFIDFLSVLRLDQPEFRQLTRDADFLILNSVNLLKRSTDLIRSYREVNTFFDNDPAGRDAKEKLKAQRIAFCDASYLYPASKDVNKFLVSKIETETERIENTPVRKSKGRRL